MLLPDVLSPQRLATAVDGGQIKLKCFRILGSRIGKKLELGSSLESLIAKLILPKACIQNYTSIILLYE